MSTKPQCEAVVYKRDTYRYTGRTKSRFQMHYTRAQCSRAAVTNGLCRQHAAKLNPARVQLSVS
jgi:hypothetical protein